MRIWHIAVNAPKIVITPSVPESKKVMFVTIDVGLNSYDHKSLFKEVRKIITFGVTCILCSKYSLWPTYSNVTHISRPQRGRPRALGWSGRRSRNEGEDFVAEWGQAKLRSSSAVRSDLRLRLRGGGPGGPRHPGWRPQAGQDEVRPSLDPYRDLLPSSKTTVKLSTTLF